MANPERIQYEDVSRLSEGNKAADKFDEQGKIREIGQGIIAKLRESETFDPSRGGFTMNPDTTRDVLRKVNTLKSLQDAERYKEEFDRQYDEIKGNIRTYFRQLDQHSDIFGKRVGKDTLREYKDEFARLKPAEQKTRLAKLSEEITSRQRLHDELKRLVGKDHTKEFDQLRRSEKKNYLDQLNQNIKAYEKTLDAQGLKGRERADKLTVFKESTLRRQQEMMREAKVESGTEGSAQTRELVKQYGQFAKTRQKKYPNFAKLPPKQKTETVNTMREELRHEYQEKFEICPYLSGADKQDCRKTILGNFNIATAELCLRYFPKHERLAQKIAQDAMKFPPQLRKQYNFDELRFTEKQRALDEMKEHVALHEKYRKKVDKLVKDRLLAENSGPQYTDWYLKLPLAQKKQYAGASELDTRLTERKETLRKFENRLPKAIQKEYADQFYEADLDKRRRLADMLLAANAAYDAKYEQKLNGMVKRKLLAEKSEKSYMRSFKNDLPLSKKARLSVFDPSLEAPFRQILLDHFKALPKEIQTKIEKRFLEGTRRERWEILKKHAPDNGSQLDRDISVAQRTHDVLMKQEAQAEKHTKLRLAEKFELEERYALAVEMYRDILEQDPDDKEIRMRIKDLEGRQAEEAGGIANPVVRQSIYEAAHDTTLSREMDELAALGVFAEHVAQSQRIRHARGAKERVAETLSDDELTIHEELFAQTGGKQFLDTEGEMTTYRKLRTDRLESHQLDPLRREAREMRGNTNTPLDTVDLTDAGGRILSEDEFMTVLRAREEALKQAVADRAGKKLKDKLGTDAANIDEIRERIDTEDLDRRVA